MRHHHSRTRLMDIKINTHNDYYMKDLIATLKREDEGQAWQSNERCKQRK